MLHLIMASGSREDRDREAKLREASKEGRKDDIIQLLKQGVDVNGADDEGWSSLMWASERGHVECVKMLLEGGAQANQHSNHGWTSLMGASRRGHVDCIKMLLEGGANANQQDNWGRTSLIDASEGGHVECIRILLEGGAQANQQDRDGMTSLLYASRERHVECTRVLLEGGAQANLPNLDGMTSLMYASREGDVECTRVLLEGGAKANQQDKRKVTALMEASYNGHVECTRVLLKGGAEAHLQNWWGRTSLIDASEGGHVECIRILLEGGAKANQQDDDGMTSLMYASRQGHVECTRVLLEGGAKANQQDKDGDTALHIAMRFGKSDCVRTLLSHPGMDPNIKNTKGLTAMNVQPCAYGKVMLCGHSGAGKSTLVEAILQRSLPTVTKLKKRLFGANEVEPLTAGIIPHQIDHSSMIIYDLAGQQQFFSSHSAYLEAMSPYSPAIFLLLHDLRKDPDDITKELHHWAAMIDGVCHKCPKKSSVIVVGTHADLLKKQQVPSKIDHLKLKSSKVITHQNLVDVVTLNLKKPYSTEIEQFMELLNKTNKAVISMCPPIPGHCPLLLNFLKVKLPPDAHAISLSDLHARITGDKDMQIMDPQLSTIIQSLKILTGRGLIALILSNDPPNNSWVVLQKECILKKVNGTLFADSNLKEYRQLSSNTGIIPKAVLREAFPEYDVEMIAQFMIQFEMCQLVDLSKIDTNMKAEGSDLGPLLFFPALVREDRPSSVIVPENSFRWHMIVKSPHQFFTPRFHDVLLHRLTLQFPLPAVQATSGVSRRCEVWKNGIKWLSGSGVTTIVEMDGIPFQSLSLAMSFPHLKCHNLFHLVLNTIKAAFNEFCPYLDAVELVSFPSKDSSEIRVELSRLQDALRSGDMSIIDESRNRPVNIAEWLVIEPCLPRFIGVKDCPQYHSKSTTICDKHPAVMEGDLPGVEAKGSAGEDQAVNEGDISSEDCHANSLSTPSAGQHTLSDNKSMGHLLDPQDVDALFKIVQGAKAKWRDIGRELGFTLREMNNIVTKKGTSQDQDYFEELLDLWLNWAPPTKHFPCTEDLLDALRHIGQHKLALMLEQCDDFMGKKKLVERCNH